MGFRGAAFMLNKNNYLIGVSDKFYLNVMKYRTPPRFR